MTDKTIIASEKIAQFLNELMIEKKITTYDLEKKGIAKNKIYSVLRRGDVQRPNYTIDTFIEVLGAVGVHLELHDLGQKSNLDLDKTGQN